MSRDQKPTCPFSQTRAARWTRRDWLRTSVSAFAAASAGLGRGRAAATAPDAPVAIARCQSYETPELTANMETLFDQLGGIERLVRGKTVAIKLNLTGTPSQRYQGRPLGSTHYCHPNLVGVVCALLDKAGVKRIRLVESGFGTAMPLDEYMLDAGWNVRALKRAATLIETENTNSIGSGSRYATVKVPNGGHMFGSFLLNQAYEDTDVFLTIAKLKNHATCGVTLSLKNSFGITPSSIYGGDAGVDEPNESPRQGRGPLHDGSRQPSKIAPPENDPSSPRDSGYRVPRIVADLAVARPIDLQIIDGVETMIGGEGPWIGDQNLRFGKPGLLIAGLNPVCTDAVATAVMGYDPRATRGTIPFRNCDNTMLLAEAHGVGTTDLSRIDVRGLSVKEALFPFEPAPAAGRADGNTG
jgi:uncharacterized protein (DUF362 family)